MTRSLALKISLGITGVLFIATIYPMVVFLRTEPALAMMFSVYITLGVFLLLAIHNPAAHRSLIAFTGWSSLVHAVVMAGQALAGMVARVELIGCAVLAAIGIVLIALLPVRVP